MIVDNAVYCFGYQLENGIPIITWNDDPYDKELFNLGEYMSQLVVCEDVRTLNRTTFNLETFYSDYMSEYLNKNIRTKSKTSRRK